MVTTKHGNAYAALFQMEIVSNEEIAQISTDVWARILKPSEARPVKEGESISVANPNSHYQYSAVHLNLFEKKDEKNKDTEDSDSNDENELEDGAHFDLPSATRIKPSEFYDEFVARTPEQCAEELLAPQKSEKWLQARKYCITASQFGSAIGTSPYQTPDALVVDKLWNTFVGNAATQWGNDHEPHAKESFCIWFGKHIKVPFKFVEENLMKFSDEPWLAVSPDGIVQYEIDGHQYEDLVEFKCPAYFRNSVGHPYAKYTKQTPPQYLSQIQGIMGYLNSHGRNFRKCWFVVWQPHQTWIVSHDYDPNYYEDMHDKLRKWYFGKLLPAFAHQKNGLLCFGECVPQEVLEIA
jgi:putative phage-type endonuclease